MEAPKGASHRFRSEMTAWDTSPIRICVLEIIYQLYSRQMMYRKIFMKISELRWPSLTIFYVAACLLTRYRHPFEKSRVSIMRPWRTSYLGRPLTTTCRHDQHEGGRWFFNLKITLQSWKTPLSTISSWFINPMKASMKTSSLNIYHKPNQPFSHFFEAKKKRLRSTCLAETLWGSSVKQNPQDD